MSENKNITQNVNSSAPPQLKFINLKGTIPFAIRTNTTDPGTFQEIFQYGVYNLPIKDFQPKLILDCGGNIGCASVFFANVYPNAQIYSIEPERRNFKILTYNTVFYDNIHQINSALWDKETFIKIANLNTKADSYRTVETTADDPQALRTTTVSKILAESGFDEIDLLKIDIEGAEKEVFSAPDVDDWLSKVKVLVIELHDRMKKGCSRAVFTAMSKYDWHFTLRGPNLIFMRE